MTATRWIALAAGAVIVLFIAWTVFMFYVVIPRRRSTERRPA